jgi:UDP:flavonoid glycosyltransferase YjiC (YdhE family)
MQVTMLTLGSRGDVQPFVAFGLGLERAGHRVRLATYPRLEHLVSGQGLEFAPLAEGAISLGTTTPEGRRWAERGSRRLPTWVGFLRDARSVAHRRLADAAAACEGADVIVANNLAQVLGWQMSDRMRVPLVRTLFHAPTYWMSRRTWRPVASAARQAAWLAARPWLNSVRRDVLGLQPLPLREPIAGLDRRQELVLYPFSTAVFSKPAGWGDGVEVTGYWFLDAALDPEPPDALVEFLAEGPPPVCIGFGTQLDAEPVKTTRLMIEALSRAGRRGVLVRSPQELGGMTLPPEVFAVQSVSHTWLFPRCAAVAHHAGAGTTAAALRAGTPSVLVPHNSDQFSWARRLHELGVGPPLIARRKLSAERLAQAIRLATTRDEYRRRAAGLREVICAEDGVAHAIEAFERYIGAGAAQGRLVKAAWVSTPASAGVRGEGPT